jgi:hypothetical protein
MFDIVGCLFCFVVSEVLQELLLCCLFQCQGVANVKLILQLYLPAIKTIETMQMLSDVVLFPFVCY